MPISFSNAQVNGLDLVFLLRITDEFHSERVEQLFRDAGAASSGEDLSVKPISVAQYELYKLMVTQPNSFIYGADLTPVMELDKTGGNSWRVHQKNPGERLKGIWVRYSAGTPEETVAFHETQDSSSEDAVFRILKQDEGNYQFRPKSKDRPDGYQLVEAAADATQAPLVGAFKPWPASSLHYLIRVEDYQGEEHTLNRLKDELAHNKHIGVLDSADGLFSFAAFRSVAAQLRDAWAADSYTVTVGFLGGKQGQQPNKAWLLFPLTSAECDKVEEVLESRRYTEKTFADMLNNRVPSPYPVFRTGSDGATELAYRDVSAWHELPLSSGGFGRSFRLDASDLPQWRRKYPSDGAHGILVYEGSLYRNGVKIPNEPRVIPQQDINKGSMLWRRLELPSWQPGLEGLAL